MPARRKPVGTRVRERDRQGNVTLLRAPEDVVVPDPPEGLLPSSVKTWTDYWSSDVARAVDARSQMRGLVRWIEAVDQIDRLRALVREHGYTTTGSTGQLRLNPLLSEVKTLEAVVAKAEEAYGMTPKAAQSLGLANGAGGMQATADALNEAVRQSMPERVRAASDDGVTEGWVVVQ